MNDGQIDCIVPLKIELLTASICFPEGRESLCFTKTAAFSSKLFKYQRKYSYKLIDKLKVKDIS